MRSGLSVYHGNPHVRGSRMLIHTPIASYSRSRHSPLHMTALLVSLALLPLALVIRPVFAAGASYTANDPRLQQAVVWARQQMYGQRLWIEDGETLCGTFVENAYGVSGVYPSAHDMYRALGKSSDPSRHTLAGLQRAPVGSIVFFAPNARNGYYGHVGIYVGGGQFIGVGSGGHVRQYSVQWWSGSISPFVGWAYPPSNWPGRGIPSTDSPFVPAVRARS